MTFGGLLMKLDGLFGLNPRKSSLQLFGKGQPANVCSHNIIIVWMQIQSHALSISSPILGANIHEFHLPVSNHLISFCITRFEILMSFWWGQFSPTHYQATFKQQMYGFIEVLEISWPSLLLDIKIYHCFDGSSCMGLSPVVNFIMDVDAGGVGQSFLHGGLKKFVDWVVFGVETAFSASFGVGVGVVLDRGQCASITALLLVLIVLEDGEQGEALAESYQGEEEQSYCQFHLQNNYKGWVNWSINCVFLSYFFILLTGIPAQKGPRVSMKSIQVYRNHRLAQVQD